MKFLLDTNVLSELQKRTNRDPGVTAWFASVGESELAVSVLVIGEIRRGVEMLRKREPARAIAYEDWLALTRRRFAERILDVDERVAEEWGRISSPRPIPIADALLAATAIVHDLSLVTRNVKDVHGTGVRTLNPFSR